MRSRLSTPPAPVSEPDAANEAPRAAPSPREVAARRRRLVHILARGAIRAAMGTGPQEGPGDGHHDRTRCVPDDPLPG